MILNTSDITVAYRCPECGDEIFSVVGVFNLSGDMIKIRCKNCGGSALTITRTGDGKLRFSVPCIACPKPHNYMLSSSTFTKREKGALSLACPYTGIDICFIGDKESVSDALFESDKELLEIMKEAGAQDFSDMRGSEDDYDKEEYDPMIEDIVSYVLSDLAADNAIHCKCEDGKGSYHYKFYKENLIVYCENCKTAREMRMAGTADANLFIETDELFLTD